MSKTKHVQIFLEHEEHLMAINYYYIIYVLEHAQTTTKISLFMIFA